MPTLSPINEPLKPSPQYSLPILAPAACSSPTASIADLWPLPLSLHSSDSHPAARAGAVSRPLLPRIQSISHTGRLHCAPRRYPIVEPGQLQLPRPCVLGLLQQIRGTTSSPIHSEKRDHRLKATSLERGECGNLVSVVRQTWKEHCRSRREDSIPRFWLAAAARLHAQPP